jgi:predicted transcriptional regulator
LYTAAGASKTGIVDCAAWSYLAISTRSRRSVMRVKEAVRELLDRLPDDCDFEDVLYHVYVLQQVEAGERDVRDGRVIPHEQVMRELWERWVVGAK